MNTTTILKNYGYVWVTLFLFFFSLLGHWVFAWSAYLDEQEAYNQPIEASSFFVETTRDTLENWQSEFLQLVWQVAGLSFLWFVGSPQSKEGDERKEEKIDEILRKVYGKEASKILATLDKKYPKK